MNEKAQRKQVILIDDDKAFCRIIEEFAIVQGIKLDSCQSLEDLGSIGRLSEYQLAVVDYDLGQVNGLEIAEYLPSLLKGMPMILISGKYRKKELEKLDQWPSSIKAFIHKSQGAAALISVINDILNHLSQSSDDRVDRAQDSWEFVQGEFEADHE